MSWVLAAYRSATRLLEPMAPRLLRARVRKGKEDQARLHERLGKPSLTRPEGRLVWLHGASVGEGLSLLPLVTALAERDPELNLLVTSGTATSAELLGKRLPKRVVHQYVPVDSPRVAASFLDHWRPDLAVFVESELWPNLLLECRKRGARTALVSARLSKSSLDNWRRFPAAARMVLGDFDLVLAQDNETAAGLARLGVRDDGRLNLKLAGEALPADPRALSRLQAELGPRPVVVAASTHPGEETLLLEVFAWLKDLPERPLLVIVPRHPARGKAVAAEAHAKGFTAARRACADLLTPQTEVYVADTLGELGLWFRIARLAVIGGSLVEHVGGHNPLEAARVGCPIASGPYVSNWRAVYLAMKAEQAVRKVPNAAALAGVMGEALGHPMALRAEAERAKAFAAREGAAVDQAAGRLLALVSARSASEPQG
jgi:3-deoxy-D-manno-octulosonic-acid transferase